MKREFVKILMDIHCEWSGEPPAYRVYVNDELFSERTYIWKDSFLTEILQVQAPSGLYCITVESVTDATEFTISNRQVVDGPGRWINDQTVEISHAS
jgi:hypothetical protein